MDFKKPKIKKINENSNNWEAVGSAIELNYQRKWFEAFISAKTGQRVMNLIPMVDRVYENSCRRIATNVLNEVIADSQVTTPTFRLFSSGSRYR